MKVSEILDSPFLPFCIPPGIGIVQFLIFAQLGAIGFPQVDAAHKPFAGILIVCLFLSGLVPLVGIGLGMRQVFYGSSKAFAFLGACFNGLYLLFCLLFFFGIFVTNASN